MTQTPTQPNATRPAEVTQGQLTCDRCGHKTDGGAWVGFAFVGDECLTEEDQEYIE